MKEWGEIGGMDHQHCCFFGSSIVIITLSQNLISLFENIWKICQNDDFSSEIYKYTMILKETYIYTGPIVFELVKFGLNPFIQLK